MNPYVKTNAIRFGLIVAAIGISYTLIAYLVDLKLLVQVYSGILLWLITLILLIVAVSKTRSMQGGFISFKEAFSTFIVGYIVSALVSVSFNILLFTVIDPQAAEELHELIIESTVSMMERFGAPEDQIDTQIEQMEQSNQFTIGSQLKSILWSIVVYAVIGLIVAAIMKKDRPYVEVEEESASN